MILIFNEMILIFSTMILIFYGMILIFDLDQKICDLLQLWTKYLNDLRKISGIFEVPVANGLPA